MGFPGSVKKILVCNSKEFKKKKIIQNSGNYCGRQNISKSDCGDNNLAAVKIQAAFRGYKARQTLISKRKHCARLKLSTLGRQRQSQSESSIPSLKPAVEMGVHLPPEVSPSTRCKNISNNCSKQIQPKPEVKIGRPSRTRSLEKTFMDPNEPQWDWSWGCQRVGIQERKDMNQNPQVVEESPRRLTTSAKTSTHCRSFNSNSNSSRRKGYMASTVSSRAKCRAPTPTLLEYSARRRLLFIKDSSIHR